MAVNSTSKVVFRERRSAGMSLMGEVLTFNSDDVADTDLGVEKMEKVILHSSAHRIVSLAYNVAVPTHLLELIISFKYSRIDSEAIFENVIRHPNCSPQIIEHIYEACDKNEGTILEAIAKNEMTPRQLLLTMLPSENNHDKPNKQNSHYNVSTYFLYTCLNKNTPAGDALTASKWLNWSVYIDRVWEERFDDFVNDLKKQGVDVSDWPKEWVKELVK